ncbi:RHS repeat-associated core domain-containing protein [Ornithobacterium rhinotracheale]|uniref:RHS repeat-associated core domain-containing protein n=1 Tax=Ornithobacterium rhinotracheale TaxID=28251 RepID=UPI003FA4684B
MHYNRFRYYDSDVGMFVSRDPIGLMGGSNVFAYAPNPTGWVDPWGLIYISGARSPIVISGKDKTNNSTVNISEWRRKVCKKDIGKERLNFLGANYVKVQPGKWRSLDGRRQFRVKTDDYAGVHGMGSPIVPNTPHIHMEFLTPKPNGLNFTVTKNIHIPLKDCCC